MSKTAPPARSISSPDECPDLVGVLVNQLPGAADTAGAAGLAELSVVLDVELVPPVLVGDSLPP